MKEFLVSNESLDEQARNNLRKASVEGLSTTLFFLICNPLALNQTKFQAVAGLVLSIDAIRHTSLSIKAQRALKRRGVECSLDKIRL